MRTLLSAAGLVSLVACSAEDLERLQTQTALTELSHTVTIWLRRGEVVLTVSRQLRNDREGFAHLDHAIALPESAVVTSLRIGSEGRWQPEALLDGAEASSRWYGLVGPGESEPSMIGLLEWADSGGARLRLFGLAPRATVTVEYEVQLPPTYEAGGWQFEYPVEETADFLAAAPAFDLARTPGASLERSPERTVVKLPRAPIDRVDPKWALLPLGSGRTMWRLELDAAPVLEPAPARPNVVFVIDASHSQGPEGIAAQLELLPAYLASAPDAQVEVVLYRRFALRLFNRFVPARDLPALLRSANVEPGNGSNLELGAQLAADALAQVSGVGRIVLFTDEDLRDGFSTGDTIALLARAPRDTIVHLVSRAAGGGALAETREIENRLAPIAAAGGGVMLRITGRVEDPEAAAQTMLGLVRPIRIDGFSIEAKGLDGDHLDAPDLLVEGSTLRYHALAERPPTEVTLTGKIWAREYRRVIGVDAELAGWLPGLAIGLDDIERQLTDDEARTAARAAGAVSRVTSYLSASPGAGPSRIGELAGIAGDFSGSGISCCGCRGVGVGCGLRVHTAATDFDALLRGLLTPAVAACGAGAAFSLEATGDEVVEVQVTAATPELASCLTEAAWSIRLPPSFVSHRTYAISL